MEKERNYESQIDAYLLGELTGSQLDAFERALREDPALAQRVSEERQLFRGLQHHGNEQLRARLKAIHRQTQGEASASPTGTAPSAKKRRLPVRILLTAAAGLALLIVATYLLRPDPLSGPEVFAQHYQSYPLSLTERSEPTEDPRLAQIDARYSRGDYERVLPLVAELTAEANRDPLLQMAGGIAALESRDYPLAIRYFTSIRENPDSPLADQATWYLALTHLQGDDVRAARPLHEGLAKRPEADRHTEAIAVLQQL